MSSDKKDNNIAVGILAHVDAGKTTLSEGLLYMTKTIRKAGRVDTKDAFLDTDAMEKSRGITIFSKQARFMRNEKDGSTRWYTLVDTPGHTDFSPEMERTLGILDLAVLVISAADGVNGRVLTLWQLLEHYKVPTIIFINKMDQADNLGGVDAVRKQLISQIHEKLSDGAITYEHLCLQEADEELALLDEELLEKYMAGDSITQADRSELFMKRRLFPVCFGAALRMEGVEELLSLMDTYAMPYQEKQEKGIRVFKITRDASGERLTHVKVTGGMVKSKDILTYAVDGEEISEKINQIRLYSGEKYEQASCLYAGQIGVLTGLLKTCAGQGIGAEESLPEAIISPVMTYQLKLRQGEDPYAAFRKIVVLNEEDPMLDIAYDEVRRRITLRLMGPMQKETLQSAVMERFGVEIGFEQPSVIYKETIASTSLGIGHFEPLRHYAEVHLLLEKGEEGSGIVLESKLSSDALPLHYQRLILSGLSGRRLTGVLTGSELTDVKITLVAGRAHEKHTEGGDFYQASHRALRQGLMMAENVLLEPWYDLTITVPGECLGRLLNDLSQMQSSFDAPEFTDDQAVLRGLVSVSAFGDYGETLASYTKGEGRIEYRMGPYRPCPKMEEVVLEKGYDPDLDKRHPSASVFCQHGVGTIIPWYDVPSYAHADSGLVIESGQKTVEYDGDFVKGNISRAGASGRENGRSASEKRAVLAGEDELKAIFERTYGPVKSKFSSDENDAGYVGGKDIYARTKRKWNGDVESSRNISSSTNGAGSKSTVGGAAYGIKGSAGKKSKSQGPRRSYLLVDGYNIIFAWDELRKLAEGDIKAARDRLMEILSGFGGCISSEIILVFDAYKVSGGQEQVLRYHNISVIFTREAETADQYIEKAAREMVKQYDVTVATSDGVEQVIIFGAGAARLTALELLEDVQRAQNDLREKYLENHQGGRYFLQNNLSGKLAELRLDNDEGDKQ